VPYELHRVVDKDKIEIEFICIFCSCEAKVVGRWRK